MFRLLPILYIVVPFLKLVWRLLRDRRVPLFTKIIPVIAFLYLAWPTDIIKDFIPILGHLDDLVVVSLLLLLFIAASPGQVVADQTIGKKLRDLQRQYGQDEKKEPSQGKTVEAEIRYVEEEEDDDENREQK